MALALQLTNAGVTVKSIHTSAKVQFEERDDEWSIHRIDLDTEASTALEEPAPRTTVRSREPCLVSIFDCELSSCEFRCPDCLRLYFRSARKPCGNRRMIINSSDQVPRTTLLKRFPIPRNFGVNPESRIGRGKTWPAPDGATRVKTLEIYRYHPGFWRQSAPRYFQNRSR